MSDVENKEKTIDDYRAELMNVIANPEPVMDVTKEPVNNSQEREFSDIEKQALEKGWKPDGKKDAETFLEFGSILEEVKSRGKELKALKKEIEYTKKTAYEQALHDLKEQRREAIELGDPELVDAFDSKLEVIKDQMKNLAPMEDESSPDALVQNFINKHSSWWNSSDPSDVKIRVHAFELEEKLAKLSVSPADRLAYIEADIKDKFPEKFGGNKASALQAVEATTHEPPRAKSVDMKSLSELNEVEMMCYKYQLQHKGADAAKNYLKEIAKNGKS